MNSTSPNILVTGATGFIGGHVARVLRERGHRVVILHRRTPPPEGESLTLDALEKAERPFDAIIHAAAIRHRHGIPAADYLTQNTALTEKLLGFARRSGSGRFVLVSSIAVFGWPKRLPISDENPYAPVGPYGESKISCEEKVRSSGHPYAIVRPSITYGPGDTNGMIDKLFRLVLAGKYRVIGRGHARCQLVYVGDLAHAIVEAALRPGLDGAEFTCTFRDPITLRRLAELACETADQPLRRPGVPLPVARLAATGFELLEKIGLIRGEPLVTHEKLATVTVDRAYDIARMRQILGWEPPTGYAEGLRKTLESLSR